MFFARLPIADSLSGHGYLVVFKFFLSSPPSAFILLHFTLNFQLSASIFC